MKYLLIILIFGVNILYSQPIINEIMYNPSGTEPEWIELFNNSALLITDTFRIEDPVRQYSFYINNLKPKFYGILVKDTALLKSYRKLSDSAILIETKLPGMNNDKDSLYLKRIDNKIIDHFYYKGTWAAKGISLERKSVEYDADNIGNLKQSTDKDSATCGRTNSISELPIDTIPKSDLLEISPNPFSPNSTKGKSICNIVLSISNEFSSLKIIVYDMGGNEILSIADKPEKSAPGKFSYNFEGMNEKGFALQPGIYPILIQYQESDTGKWIHYKELIVIGG